MAFLSQEHLNTMKFKHLGANVRISDKSSIYNSENIIIGDNCRIDDFCILSAGVRGIIIGRNVHIAVYASLIGAEQILISDYANISARVSIYSSNDDYSGQYMTNPTVAKEFTNVEHKPVYLGKHAIVGSGSIILPGAKLNTGVAVGALSLILGRDYQEFMIYAGSPAKVIKERSRDLLKLEKNYNLVQLNKK